GCGRPQDGQPALSPPCPANPAGLRAPVTAPVKRVRALTGSQTGELVSGLERSKPERCVPCGGPWSKHRWCTVNMCSLHGPLRVPAPLRGQGAFLTELLLDRAGTPAVLSARGEANLDKVEKLNSMLR